MPDERLKYLLEQYFANGSSEAEKDELADLVADPQQEAAVLAFMDEHWPSYRASDSTLSGETSERILQKILGAPVVSIKPKRFTLSRIAVAASVIILLGIGAYVISNPDLSAEKSDPPLVKADDVIAPDKTKATITLADGRTISLDSLTTLTQQNVQVIRNANGEIIYSGNSSDVVYNTLSNPRGSQVVNLTLSDGTKVWLNSESSIRYPIAFAGNTRPVQITGEAYFEVAKDPAKKFTVTGNGITTEVLGTHFNINTYADAGTSKVTLLEGSVKVTKAIGGVITNNTGAVLKPGQQAILPSLGGAGGGLTVASNVDLDQVMAWRNGLFRFSATNIKEIMQQAGRWYDVTVRYEVPTEALDFSGIVSRKDNLSELLKILEATGLVKFRKEGRTVVVTR